MRDVLLWRALHGGTDVASLTDLLKELAAAPLPKRALSLHGVLPLVTHRTPRVRELAVRSLGGAFGMEARQAIAGRLDDADAAVRVAAVDALAACCVHDGAPFACALFHKRVDVRKLALERAPARVPVAHQILMLRDDAVKRDVEAMLDRRAADGAIVPALLAARAHGLMDDASVIARLAKLPWLEKPGEVLAAMPFAAVVDAHTASADGLRGYLTTLTQTDPLADVLSLLWTGDDGIVATLIEARRKSRLKDPEHRRLAIAFVQVMLMRGAATPRMLALVSLAVPVALMLTPDKGVRRAALAVLPEIADPELSGKLTSVAQLTAAKGGDPSLLLDDASELHTPSVAGALRLLSESPYQKLREFLTTTEIVKAFWRDPLSSMTLLSMPPRAPADREAYRALAKGIVDGMHASAPDVVAALAVCLPSEGSFALEDLEKPSGRIGVVERALFLLLADARSRVDEIFARRLERNAATLAAQLSAGALAKVLAAAVRVVRSGSALLEAVPVAALTADAVFRACPKAHLGAALATLDDASLTAIVARLDESVLPLHAEHAWAQLLERSSLDKARAWASPRVAVTDAPREIGAGLKASLEKCGDDELPLMTSAFLREPLTGLTDVLATRAASSSTSTSTSTSASASSTRAPSARLAAALLASHDPPHAVADAFQGAITEEPAFLAAIDQALLDEDTRRDLPVLATAWIHHDAGQAVRFEHHCRTVPGGPRAVVELALALPCPMLSWKVMRALVEVVRSWTFQRKALLERLDGKLAELLVDVLSNTAVPRAPTARITSTFAGARAVRRLAAELVALAHGSGKAAGFVAEVRERLLRDEPDLDGDLRALLKDVATWKAPPPPPPATFDVAREKLRSVDAHAARAAVDELNKAGPAGGAAIIDALVAKEPPLCLKAIIERAIFDGDTARRLLDEDVDPEVRFRVAMRLDDGKAALAAACAKTARPWLVGEDMEALAAKVPARSFATRLATSPHAPAYTKAVWSLLSLFHDDRAASEEAARARADDVRAALLSFLEVDDEREPSLRAEVAAALVGAQREDRGARSDAWLVGFGSARRARPSERDSAERSAADAMIESIAPVLVRHVLEYQATAPRHETLLRDAVTREVWREVIASAQLTGDGALSAALETLMHKRVLDDDLSAAIALMLLKSGIDKDDARPLFAIIRRARFFADDDMNIDALRDAVQWGIRQARVLLGRPVSVEMIHDAFGYTRLHQPRIFINPLPLLRGERGGDDVVRGLMVHEIGHHLYNADELGKACWAEAQKEGIQGLLNLVADEHLERNLRAESEVYGDHLKVLAAYAFQHMTRDVWVELMLRHLGRDAALILPTISLLPGKNYGCVQIELGRLLAELSDTTSFARFMRALRMGLGATRSPGDATDGDDPKVKTALALFEKTRGKKIGFRASKMDWLLEIARELKRIFGDETKILETFGLHETMDCSEDDLMEEGLSSDELQRALDKKSGVKTPRKIDKPKWNDGPDTAFEVIEEIVPLPHDPVAHRAIAEQGRSATKSIRKVFDELGTKIVVEHRRLSGRSLDRQGLQSAILRMDPRLLVRRTPVPAADLFVGIVVDCSGSMASEQSMDKARVFATSLAEAARGRTGIDVKVFGFTDSIIYEAGTADRCAAHALTASGGNNDAAGLWHASVHAKRSKRKKKLLVMVSDGLPTECSAESLRSLALRLERGGMLTAQVAVRPIETQLFRHYVEILDDDIDDAARRFSRVIAKLVRKTMGR